MTKIRILSLPSRHPYMSKFNVGKIGFINPDSDFFSEGKCYPNYLGQNYPPNSYDIVHIHFSFDRISIKDLRRILKYFKQNNKPIVWTSHSKESQRIKNYGKGVYQKLLFKYSDKIISPTKGCAQWLKLKFGEHRRPISIIPLGFMADPDHVKKFYSTVKKDRNLFTMLIGDFRENKEFIQPIINFLQCTELKRARLQLIFKPIFIYKKGYSDINLEMMLFYSLLWRPRIRTLSLPNISNDTLTRAFLASHAIIMWYKWGTHSGQIELAKDCGCHVVASNVGFYKEQWEHVCLWDGSDGKYTEYPYRYTNALIQVYKKSSIKPAGSWRKKEFKKIFRDHTKVYKELLR